MKKINIKNMLAPSIAIIVLLVLLAIGTFFDLDVSNALVSLPNGGYYSNNLFGKIFEIIGEMPIYLITAFACALLFHNFNRREKGALKLFVQIFTVVASVGLLFYMNYKLFKYFSQHFDFSHLLGGFTDYLAYAILGGCFTAILFYLTRKLPSSFLNATIVWAIIVLGTALLSQVLTHGLKDLAGRPRYRAMFVMGDFSIYRKWFEFQAIPEITEDLKLYCATADWFKSFPSGHTSAGACVVTLVGIPSLFAKTNNLKSKVITLVCVTVYVALVMLSRIIVGAHFLTDVVMGCLITVVSYLVSSFAVKKLFPRLKLNDLKERTKPCLIEESTN